MQYRALGKSGLTVSEIAIGCEHLEKKPRETVLETIDAAVEGGVNLMDLFNSEPQVRSFVGEALRGRRDKLQIQGHIGSTWSQGQYTRSRDLEACKRALEDLLTRLNTDHLELGALHYVDEPDDWDAVANGPVAQYALELKRQGVIRAISLSSHDPRVALAAARSGIIDAMLFSINPAWDLIPHHDLFTEEGMKMPARELEMNPDRALLYSECQRLGVGIFTMKTYAAGALLNGEASPFHVALTTDQCIGWALSRPAVASVAIGVKSREEVQAALAYENATDGQKDAMAVLKDVDAFSAMRGKCMYCNHCLPCPAGIDVAAVGRCLDLALTGGSVTAAEHYNNLSHHAGECLACGSCEGNCPFSVPVIQRMEKAREIFGK